MDHFDRNKSRRLMVLQETVSTSWYLPQRTLSCEKNCLCSISVICLWRETSVAYCTLQNKIILPARVRATGLGGINNPAAQVLSFF